MASLNGDRWDPSRLQWDSEEIVNMLLDKTAGDRKARTREELEAVRKEPMKVAPTRTIWIHESLLDEARRLWEQMATDRRRLNR